MKKTIHNNRWDRLSLIDGEYSVPSYSHSELVGFIIYYNATIKNAGRFSGRCNYRKIETSSSFEDIVNLDMHVFLLRNKFIFNRFILNDQGIGAYQYLFR